MTLRRAGFALSILCSLSTVSGAQLAATVSATDPVYAAVDEVAATLPVPGIATGQRPWSRRELARILLAFHEALQRRRARVPARAASLVDSLNAAYADDIRALTGAAPVVSGAPVRMISLQAVGTDADARPVWPFNGLGHIDALTNPIVEPNGGRPVVHGATFDFEALGEIGLGRAFAVGVQPRMSWLQPRDQAGWSQADFQRLYARLVMWNVAAEAGLDQAEWGQAGDRGLLLSANPRPLHAITLSNDTAFSLPWIFGGLGRVRAALTFAQLGNTQNFPGAQLVTYKISITPTSRLELGAALQDQMGGGGSPHCSVTCRIEDLFPYIFWLKPGSDSLATNKIGALDLRYRIPEAGGLTLYYELSLDDFDARRPRSMLWTEDGGHVLGATFDRLDGAGRWALDVQGQHMPLRLYEHWQFKSGVTYRQAIIGDPLGPAANAGYSTLTWRPGLFDHVAVSGALEARDNSMYTVHISDAHANGWTLIRTAAGVTERRARAEITYAHSTFRRGLAISPRLAVERVQNDGFVAGHWRTNVLADLTARITY